MSTVVVADGSLADAEAARDRILAAAWADREDFVWRDEPLADAIARAARAPDGPVLLIDHADNCASGGTQDTMHVLAEALRQGLTDIAVGPVRDPAAVDRLVRAGIGATVTLPIGGVFDLPAIGRTGEPLELTGTVRTITDGRFTVTGPQSTGVEQHMGRTVVFDTGAALVVLTERQQEPLDVGVFTSVGIDPTAHRYLLLKSRMYFRPVFLPIAKETVYCNGVGVTSSDWTLFRYEKVRRPIFPLDPDATY
jgi:microcystin degradation protein MlrC